MRDRPQRGCMGPLPDQLELHLIPDGGAPLPEGLLEAEFLVPPYNHRPLLEALGEMSALRVVQAASAGVEWLLPWVPDGVTVCTARGARDVAVAEWVIAAILAMEKRTPAFASRQAARMWSPELLDELAGKHALLVGYGSSGRCVAERLAALGVHMQAIASAPRERVRGPDALEELLGGADIVVVLVPLTPQTHHLFDGHRLDCMRRNALLVNASRGAVVDTAALVERLQSGRLRAALDVTDPEPLPDDHPLWEMDSVLITPHVAGDSPQAEERVYRLVGEQLRRYSARQPLLNVVGAP
jgi:phosphoglycerate dehydrogenase-like enzyme